MPAIRLDAPMVGRAAAFLVALASGVLAFHLAGPRISGHDEGVYVATARALAASGEYRLIDLPSSPPQTKYPPLYPAALALVEWSELSSPERMHALKIVNAAALALIVVLTGELASRLAGDAWRSRVVGALLAGSSLALVSFVDLVQSDLLFVALALSALLAAPKERDGISRGLLCGILLGLGVLTRLVGVAIALGAVLASVRRRPRALLALVASTAMLAAPWLIWANANRARTLGPLEQYYVSYEPSAWTTMVRDPLLSLRVILVNGLDYVRSLGLVLDAPTVAIGLALLGGVALGTLRARRRPILGVSLTMGAVYLLTVLGHPMAMGRYLLPAVPVVLALLACASACSGEHAPRGPVPVAVGTGCVVVVLLAHAIELRHYAALADTAVHVGFGQFLPAGRPGFDETAAWIRRNTPADAVLASGNDTVIFVETGRRAVRPWVHAPIVYNAGYGAGQSAATATERDVSSELRSLGVSYLVMDPLLPDLEGAYAAGTIRAILDDRRDQWAPMFTSSDGAHTVYRRTSPLP